MIYFNIYIKLLFRVHSRLSENDGHLHNVLVILLRFKNNKTKR